MINKELVADLDQEILEIALQVFLKNASEEVLSIVSCFSHNDYKEIKRLAHKLKGSSIAVGLEAFSEIARSIEDQILVRESEMKAEIEKLKVELNRIKHFLTNESR